jgi:type IV pilus assembly protein PilY1
MGNIRRIVRQQGPEFTGDSTIYGFDGPPTLYVEDTNADGTIDHTAGEKAILYAGLRRGGRAYYALDVSNPEAPKLIWRIVGGVTPEFEDLGWTFSQPRTGKVRIGTDIVPVVIFGGGFDRAYDNQLASVSGPTGRGIYIVNALTGDFLAHIEHAGMQDSIPSPVSAVDTSGDGLVDRIYVGDLGGRVWRVDLVAGNRQAPGQRPCSPTWVAVRQGVQLAGLTIGASSMPRTSSSPACWSMMAQGPWRRSSSMPS